MANNVAPGIYSNTIDQSHYTAEEGIRTVQSLHTIFSSRGPDNVIVQFTSNPLAEIRRYYGEPKFNKFGQSYHTALQWAEQGYETAICRLMPEDAKYANIALVYKKSLIKIGTVKEQVTVGGGKLIKVKAEVKTPEKVSLLAESSVNYSEIKDLIVYKEIIGGKIQIGEDMYTVESVSYRKITLEEEDPDGEGQAPEAEYEIDITVKEEIKTQIEISAEVKQQIKSVVTKSYEDLTAETKVEEKFKAIDVSKEEVEVPLILFYPYGRGADYNKLSISMYKETDMEETYPGFALYTLRVFDRSSENGVDFLLSDEEFMFALDPDAVDMNGNSLYIDDIIPTYSKYIKYHTNPNLIKKAICDLFELDIETATEEEVFVNDIFASYTDLMENKKNRFSNGSDGSLLKSDGTLNWYGEGKTIADLGDAVMDPTTATGMLMKFYNGDIDKKLLNKKWVPAKYIWDNNYPVPVKIAMSQLCAGIRNDIRAILDTGFQSDPMAELGIRKGTMVSINDKNTAIYPNNGYTVDKYTGKKIFVTATYNVCKLYAIVKNTLGFHYAIAGYNSRGKMDEMTSVTYSPELQHRNEFTKNQLNTIIHDPDGIFIMENITSQKALTALQQNSIADTLQVMIRETERFCEKYLFTIRITDQSLKDIQGEVSSFLSKWVSNGACEWIEVKVSASAQQRANQKAKVDVFVKFANILKQLELNFIVKGEGATV